MNAETNFGLVFRSSMPPIALKVIIVVLLLLLHWRQDALAETWITERKVHIDRCASAWFISRFVDPDPEFVYIAQGESPPVGNSFDFFGAKYFHHGSDCTFTTLVKSFKQEKNASLIAMNSTVNDAFGWMNAPGSFAAEFRELIADLEEVNGNDAKTVADMAVVFDLLYAKLGGSETEMLESARTTYRKNTESVDEGSAPGGGVESSSDGRVKTLAKSKRQ